MANRSAGILMYRRVAELEVFLVHPGGPLWARKDDGAWTIPKGGIVPGEEPADAAMREFLEETGFAPGAGLLPLTPIRQRGGKVVLAFAVEGDCRPEELRSNTFEMEWPPRSGQQSSFPEVDRGEWFSIPRAREKINPAQAALLDELSVLLQSRG